MSVHSQPSWVNCPNIPRWILSAVKLLVMKILMQYNRVYNEIAFLWCSVVNPMPKPTVLRASLCSLLRKLWGSIIEFVIKYIFYSVVKTLPYKRTFPCWLFVMYVAALHIWRHSPLSTIWWQVTHLTWHII